MTSSAALEFLQSLQLFGFQPGLESTRRLAEAAGRPQDRLQFIHVAGTNGKGSVCAFLESIYRHSGRRVGLYSSPHLVRFGERLQINRELITDADLARHVGELKEIAETMPGLQPTFFEFTTVLALRYFAEQAVELVVWETGLGGRLDATNIVTPLASVITNIGLDHIQVLGPTIAAIAAEKAGIIKPGVPVLTAAEEPDAEAILRFKARELDSPYLPLGPAEVAAFRGEVGLIGPHQRTNGALAAATVRLLRAVLPVSDEHLRVGLSQVRWLGRLQVVERGEQRIILDGAHNLAGARALRAALPALLGTARPALIIGLLADKDYTAILKELVPLASRVLTVPVASGRTLGSEELRAAVLATGAGRPVKAAGSLAEALKGVTPDPWVVITGSLYLVGEALEQLAPESSLRVEERRLNDWSGGPGRSAVVGR